MCVKVKCNKCGLATWKGCGKHIAQVLKNVPADERCKCRRNSIQNMIPIKHKIEKF